MCVTVLLTNKLYMEVWGFSFSLPSNGNWIFGSVLTEQDEIAAASESSAPQCYDRLT